MNTSFDEIYSLSMVTIRDYQIDKIFNPNDLTDFQNLMKGFLQKAIPKFTNCNKNLESIVNFDADEFTEELTLTEKVILSDLLIIEWLNSKILDVRQFQNILNDTDFKLFSQAQNLDSKMKAREVLREIVNQDMNNYGLKQIPWDEWARGNFNGT